MKQELRAGPETGWVMLSKFGLSETDARSSHPPAIIPAAHSTEEVADLLVRIPGRIEIAETRVW